VTLVGVEADVSPDGAMIDGGGPGPSRLVLETLDLEIWGSNAAFPDLPTTGRARSGRDRPCSAIISLVTSPLNRAHDSGSGAM